MGSNRFGNIFQVTTWGESHGKAIGLVIDGCPANLPLNDDDINAELKKRRPGTSPLTSPRKESDIATIYSGVFEGKTTGAPISIIIPNRDADPSKYKPLKNLYRPGHANFTYQEKYGHFDYLGGGRASARETACRVAAGAVAKKLLGDICITATLVQVGQEKEHIADAILQAADDGDSLGGIIECIATNVPAGLGDPVYEKFEANLAKAMLSIPASKGFEIGSGFKAATMRGSEHNDPFTLKNNVPVPATNNAGGVLGGITTGAALRFRIAFKPTSSIKKEQDTVTTTGEKTTITLPEGSRHDPCVAVRAVPVVEAMCACTLADALLCYRLDSFF